MVEDISASGIIEMRNKLKNESNPHTLEIKQVKKEKVEEQAIIEDALIFKESEMLQKYVVEKEKSDALGNLNKDKLLEIGKNICEEITND